MTGSFTFTGLPEIHFGPKTIDLLPGKIRKYGTRVLLVLGGRSFQESVHGDKLQQSLEENKIQYFVIHIDYEPTPQLIDQATGHYRNENVDVVVSIGGGSVMDAGKAISAMLTQDGSVVSFLEDVGNRKHDGRKVPFIALPTTSGTGSEVTKNAVICERGPTGYKKSLRHDNFIPDMAIVDPELTISCPGHITASSGLDAFSQLLESYTSTTATIITDSLAFTAIRCAARSVLNAYLDGQNINVRSDMAYTALISGITLANAGLGLIHGLASVISGLYDIPHGIIWGNLFGAINRLNIEKLIEQDNKSIYLKKYADSGKLFSSGDDKSIEYYALLLADKLDELVEALRLPRLGEYGIKHSDIAQVAALSGLKNNPVKLTAGDIETALRARL